MTLNDSARRLTDKLFQRLFPSICIWHATLLETVQQHNIVVRIRRTQAIPEMCRPFSMLVLLITGWRLTCSTVLWTESYVISTSDYGLGWLWRYIKYLITLHYNYNPQICITWNIEINESIYRRQLNGNFHWHLLRVGTLKEPGLVAANKLVSRNISVTGVAG